MKRLTAFLIALCSAAALLTAAIAVPTLCRPFYYAHIEPYELTEISGLSVTEIKEAYGEVLDYCTGKSPEFSVGKLHYSEEGKSHFADCRRLFILDYAVFAVSAAGLIILCLVGRGLSRRQRLCSALWGTASLGALIFAVGALAASNFDRAFTLFHTLFFPGKSNWVFSYRDDPVILLLPEDFFRNCALLILAVILLVNLVLTLLYIRRKRAK